MKRRRTQAIAKQNAFHPNAINNLFNVFATPSSTLVFSSKVKLTFAVSAVSS